MRIELTKPIIIAGRPLVALDIRPPGRKLMERMIRERVSGGFTDAATVTYAARLTGRSEITLRRLGDVDFAKLRGAIETTFQNARRRHRAHVALIDAAKAAERGDDE